MTGGTMVCPVILFYKYVPIADPDAFAAAQRLLCTELGLKGRLLIATEGINGTLVGEEQSVERYVADLRADPRFSDIEMKVSAGTPATFSKLVIKVRPEIVALKAGPEIVSDHDNHLSPEEWKKTIEEDPDVVLVDVRNSYESTAGKFKNAVLCDIEQFRDLPDYLGRLEHLKEKKVLMYCTGGIRCEKASALFRNRGFKNVFQLHGGIMTYQEQFGNEHWLGECFVFDRRMTVRVDENLVHISRCAHTGVPSARFVNCLHDPCHRLFIVDQQAEAKNPDYRLCPECLAAGLTSETAIYKRSVSA
jgi:UPF0176 protein